MIKTRTAIIIMLVAILGSSTISAVSSMNSMVTKLETHFYAGDHNDNLSIYNDITRKAKIGQNLVNMSKDYVNANDSHIKEIQKLVNDIPETKSISKLAKYVNSLDENVAWLITELLSKDLTDTHKTLLTDNYQSNYRSLTNTIRSDNYNALVKAYYDETKGFPGVVFRGIAKKAEYFE